MTERDKILRVFPRRTKATPDDPMVIIGDPPLFRPDADEVHISITFTYDRAEGERLRDSYADYYPMVKIGGPGMGDAGGDFAPGMYLKPGYVITSRGCPNRCWFCDVWKREGGIRELPITEGWNVLDDNLLACSEDHIQTVFEMLKAQPRRAEFTGGLDPIRITPAVVEMLEWLNPYQLFTAYDTDADLDPVMKAGELFRASSLKRDQVRCYVLIGYPGDVIEDAEKRLRVIWDAGYLPFAMLYRDHEGKYDVEWRQFQRLWTRPAAIKAMCK